MSDRPVALVTAAGGGIGAACARELAARGYALLLLSLGEGAAAVAAEVGAVAHRGSVTEPADLERLVADAWERYGRIDAVVNNTGHAGWSTAPGGKRFDAAAEAHLLDIPDGDWHAMLDLYFLNVVRMARLVTPRFLAAGGGSIVNISSAAAREPCYAYPSSSTLRPALAGFTKLYADRYAGDGIRMNNVLPGYLDNWQWEAAWIEAIPARRPGTLDEVARTVAFLLSPDAGYITGQSLLVDGGINRSL